MERDAENSQANQTDAWLREGIAAVKAGDNERAHELLIRVVARDEQNAQAWLWLSGVVESLEDRKICLENVLEIDPDNAHARKGLDWVQQQMPPELEVQTPSAPEQVSPFVVPLEDTSVEVTSPAAMSEPPVVERTRTPVTPAAAILREDFAGRQSPPEPVVALTTTEPESARYEPFSEPETSLEPAFPSAQVQDEFSNEYGCPYCAAETEPEDDRCRLCGKDLWRRFRKYEKRSTMLWWLITFQGANTFLFVILAVGIYAFRNELPELLGLLGQDVSYLTGLITVLALMVVLLALFSGTVLAGLYFRWKVVYWLFLAEASIEVVSSALAMAFVHPVSGIPGFISALARVIMLFQVGGDFEWDKRRILLRTDRGLKSSVEYLTRADFYNRQKMWALAVVHMRSALGLVPDQLSCHLALVVAYIRLKKYELAERALVEAKRINPGEPRIAQLEAVVNEMRVQSPALP